MRHSKAMSLAAAIMAALGDQPARPTQQIKGRPNRRGKIDGKVELEPKIGGKKADFIIIDELPPARTRAIVSDHAATKPKKQSSSLQRMLKKGKRK